MDAAEAFYFGMGLMGFGIGVCAMFIGLAALIWAVGTW